MMLQNDTVKKKKKTNRVFKSFAAKPGYIEERPEDTGITYTNTFLKPCLILLEILLVLLCQKYSTFYHAI